MKLDIAAARHDVPANHGRWGAVRNWFYHVDLYLDAGVLARMRPELIVWAKLGILIGVVLAAVSGYALLKAKLSGQVAQA